MTLHEVEDFIITRPAPKNESIVYLSNFGLSDDPQVCCGEAFSDAIDYCKRYKASHLIVPRGRYFFHTNQHIVLEGLQDFIFDGQGSEFIFSTVHTMIHIKQCERCIIQNITLDWDWETAPLASLGIVTNVSADFIYYDMNFPEYAKVDENMDIRGMNPANPNTWTPGYRGGHESFDRPLQQVKINANTIRFYNEHPSNKTYLKTDQVYIVRHFTYDSHGIVSEDCAHLSLRGIILYSCPGHAFLTYGDQHHWEIVDSKIMKRPGTTRCITATADGYHIGNSKGYFRMEHCDFSFNGDDCLNIHDNSIMGVQKINTQTLLVKNAKPVRDAFAPGDLIEFRNGDLSPLHLTLSVASVEWELNMHGCKLSFTEQLPSELPVDTILFNRRFDSGHYVIRHNVFHRNRARGILLHADHGIVEHNHFFMNQGSAIQVECGSQQSWSEGFGIRNLTIRYNYIDSCDVNHWNMAVVYMGVYLPSGRTSFPIFRDIRIENNTIVNCPQQAFFLSSCADVVVKDNVIINANSSPIITDMDNDSNGLRNRNMYHGTIMASHCDNLQIVQNTLLNTVKSVENSIFIDHFTARNVEVNNNKGFV